MRAVGADPTTTGLDGIDRHLRIGPGRVRPRRRRGAGPVDPLPDRAGPCPSIPTAGVNADWTVLGVGFAVMVVVLGASAPCSWRSSGRRTAPSGAARSCVRRSSTRAASSARSGLPPSAVAGTILRRRRTIRQGGGPVPVGRPGGRGRHDRRDHDADLRREPAHAGVPAGPLRVELGLRRAELRRVRARPEQGGGDAPARPRGHVVVRRLVRHHAARRGRGPDPAVRPRRPGRPTRHLGPRAGGAKHQIVLGAATLAQLHKRIGDTVDLKYVPGLSAPSHPAHHRRRGHHAGDRDRRGAPHLHGGRRGGARPTPGR